MRRRSHLIRFVKCCAHYTAVICQNTDSILALTSRVSGSVADSVITVRIIGICREAFPLRLRVGNTTAGHCPLYPVWESAYGVFFALVQVPSFVRTSEGSSSSYSTTAVLVWPCRMCCCWTLSGSAPYLTTFNNSTSDSLPRMQTQRLLVQF
jgi:hypothetical protein